MTGTPFGGEKSQRRARRGILGRRCLRRERLHLDEEFRPRERGDHEQRRCGAVAAEEFRANLGESSEILVTGQKRGDFHHVADSHAGVGQHRENVLPYHFGLFFDRGGNGPVGAHPDLARHMEPARAGRHLDAVRIRTDRGCDG